MPNCVKCDRELDAEAKFCLICGTPVDEKIEAAESPDPFKTVVKDAPAYGVVNLEQLPEGHLIDDRYEVKGKLGQGGFGAVYRVFDRKMECEKALKVLPEAVASDRAAMVGLKKEAVTMAKLNHPGIVHVYDFCDTGSIKYIDMEFVQGTSLSDALVDAPEGRFDEAHVTRLARQLAEGLAYAHTQGVIHKDIKAQNILINASGDPKITDFGISETVKSSMSRVANSSSAGTLVYMAPEQIRGRDVGRESDIYSFGALLYELLSGHPPFYKGAIEHQILSEPVPPLEGVSESMSRLVLRCLEKEYTDRYRNFDEVLAALDGKDVPKGSSPGGIPEPTGKASGKPMWMAVAAVVVLVAAAGVYGLVGKGSATPDDEMATAPVTVSKKSGGAVSQPVVETSLKKRIERSRKQVGGLEARITAMKSRLDSGSTQEGDSMSAMLGLIKEKTEAAQTLARLEQEQRDEVARKAREAREAQYNKLKHEVGVYEALIATEEGKSLKEAAWKELVGKFPEEARGVAAYDSVALLDGGYLRVTPTPADATIRILNIKAVYAPGMKLAPGNYKLLVTAKGHVGEKREFRLAKGENKDLKVPLVPLGRLTIDTTPADARVVLKGIKEKYSPGVQLAPGQYRVVVKAADYCPKVQLVRVSAGKATSVQIALEKELKNSLGMKFSWILPGTFMMGSPWSEPGRDDDERQHRVTLTKGVNMQTTEVTKGQWEALMGSKPSRFQNCGDDCPVVNVSWDEVQLFIRKLNAREGGNFYRLPTEAEWEYACRAGSGSLYANGKNLSSLGWSTDNSGGTIHPTASKQANAWGLHDMHGNVWEWCQDWYGDYPSSAVIDPIGPSSGSKRVKRGGSWYGAAGNCRSANRSSCSSSDSDSDLGFRLVWTP